MKLADLLPPAPLAKVSGRKFSYYIAGRHLSGSHGPSLFVSGSAMCVDVGYGMHGLSVSRGCVNSLSNTVSGCAVAERSVHMDCVSSSRSSKPARVEVAGGIDSFLRYGTGFFVELIEDPFVHSKMCSDGGRQQVARNSSSETGE